MPDEGPLVDEVNEWLDALIATVRDADHAGAGRHLIAGQEAFVDKPFLQTIDRSYDAMDYDVVNVHPLPGTRLRGADHHLGDFMSKQLRLAAFRDMTLAAHAERKPLNHDEDNVASQYRDPDGWTVHRKRAWVSLLCGAHYDVIDFSIQPFLEEGTPDAQQHLRSWFRHLSAYVHGLDLVRSRPPSGGAAFGASRHGRCVFGVPGADYSVYVADAREYPGVRGLEDQTPAEGSGEAGTAIGGALVLDLPEATLDVTRFEPTTGRSGPPERLPGGPATRIDLEPFRHDVVIRVHDRHPVTQVLFVSLRDDDRIARLTLDESGAVEPLEPVAVSGGPAPLAVDPRHRFLHVGQRRSRQISSYAILPGGELRLLGAIDARSDPNFMLTDRSGAFLLSSYYRGEGVHVHAVRADGSLDPEAVAWRDTALSAHSFQTDPGNRFAYALHIAAGVGPNAIWQYRFDAASGRLDPLDPPLVHARNEAGPRHCCFHPRLPLLYACNEQGSSVTRYRYDPGTGALVEEDSVSMVPAGYTGTSGCTQIRITSDGRLLFAPSAAPTAWSASGSIPTARCA